VSTDSSRIVLAGPTLIAFYPAATAAGPDTSEEMSTVMDDFSHHLSTASDSLRAIGFRVEMRPVDSIFVSDAGRDIAFTPPKDSADVGYYFAAPGRAPVIMYGVRTNVDIVQRARAFLASNP
jgi:hypothetical protein